jgi:hypothetical protein
VHNVSDEPALLVGTDGSRLEIAPHTVRAIPMRSGLSYRLACNECGLADGTHTARCLRR